MSTIRTKKTENYSVINNAVFAANTLSWRAMGLLSYLLSKPDNWEVQVDALVKVTEGTAKNDRKDTVYEILKELKEAGFMVMTRNKDGSVAYTIHDSPNREKPNREKPDVLINTDSLPSTEKIKPSTDSLTKAQHANAVAGGVEKRKSKKVLQAEVSVPDGIDPQAWAAYEAHRTAIRKKLTDQARELAWKELMQFNPKTQQAMINQSIRQGWTGIFPLGNQRQSQQQSAHTGFNQRDYSNGIDEYGNF